MLPFGTIPYFHCLSPPANRPLPEYQPGMIVNVQSKILYIKLTKHPFLCIPPPQLQFYNKQVWRRWKQTNEYDTDLDVYEEEEFDVTLGIPLPAAFKDFTFFEVQPFQLYSQYLIRIQSVFDTSDIFSYWINQNLITDNRFFRLGIFKDLFDFIPDGYHYYDLSYICTCGEPGCDHILALLLKGEKGNGYVPFVVDKFYGICFDLHRLNKLHEGNTPAEMEEVSHKEYEDNPESNGSVYPFYLKREDFRINPYTLKPNE